MTQSTLTNSFLLLCYGLKGRGSYNVISVDHIDELRIFGPSSANDPTLTSNASCVLLH